MNAEVLQTAGKSKRVLQTFKQNIKNYWIHFENNKRILSWHGGCLELDAQDLEDEAAAGSKKLKSVKLTMPGKVLAIHVKPGDSIEAGKSLLVIEAMKMENNILAEAAAKVGKVHVNVGDRLEAGVTLISFED